MQELTQVEKRPNECCNETSNLVTERIAEDKVIEHCQVCKARHFVIEVDMGELIGKL